MRNPLAAWRAGVRWPLATLGLVAALVVAVLVCEAIGWPFLVSPVQRWLASTLDRRVEFNDEAGGKSGVRVGLLGGVQRHGAAHRDRRAGVEQGAAHAAGARRPPAPGLPRPLARLARRAAAHQGRSRRASSTRALERRADGRASWQFGKKARPPTTPRSRSPLPNFARLRVGKGHLTYRDELLPASIEAYFALSDGSGPAAAALPGQQRVRPRAASSCAPAARPGAPRRRLRRWRSRQANAACACNAFGQYRKLPVRIELRTSRRPRPARRGQGGDGPAAAPDRQRRPRRPVVRGQHHRSAALRRRCRAGSPSPAPRSRRSAIRSASPCRRRRRSRPAARWSRTAACGRRSSTRRPSAAAGSPAPSPTRAGARCRCSPAGSPARAWCWPTSARRSARAATAIRRRAGGEDAPPGERVIPDRKFDLPSLRAMDANVLIDIAMFDPGTTLIEPLRPVRAHLLLADGVLTLADFEGRTAQGRLVGYLQLDGRGKEALWTADLRALGVDLSHWLRLKRSDAASPPYVSGKLDALVKVKGSGRSTAEILGSLNGDVRAHVRDGVDLAPRRRDAGPRRRPGARPQAQGRQVAADPVQRRRSRRRRRRRQAEGVRPQHHRLDDLRRRLGLAQDRGDGPARRRLAEGLQPADAAHADPRPRHPRRSGGVGRGRQAGRQGRRGDACSACW